MNAFERDLTKVLNKHGKDSELDMPDYILASMIRKTLDIARRMHAIAAGATRRAERTIDKCSVVRGGYRTGSK